MPVQVPQAGVQERIGERSQPAVAVYRLMIGEKTSQMFAHGCREF
jgi:hypothetical protein